MKQVLSAIEKEISKSSKAFNQATRTMSKLREKHHRDWTDADCDAFTKANQAFQVHDKALTALHTAKKLLLDIPQTDK